MKLPLYPTPVSQEEMDHLVEKHKDAHWVIRENGRPVLMWNTDFIMNGGVLPKQNRKRK